jgi:hypothetical protein
MDESYGCPQARPLLAELATGAVTGHERAAALRHVADCASCRAELAKLTTVVDALLSLTPTAEPPAGFESAVVAQIAKDRRPRFLQTPLWTAGRRLVAAYAAVVLLGAALGAGVVWWRTADDRALAEQTRQTLAEANGRYLQAARLTSATGTIAGTVFMYQGSPSWLLVSVSGAPTDGPYQVRLLHIDGSAYTIGACQVAKGSGTTGYQLTGPVASIVEVQLTGPDGTLLTAHA